MARWSTGRSGISARKALTDDPPRPRDRDRPRIRWTEDTALRVWSGYGHAGEQGAQLFTIAAPLPNSDSGYLLMSRLPGMHFACSRPRLEEAQAEAEAWLSEHIASLGAVWPETPASCSDCGAELTVAGIRYCRVDAGRRLADGVPVVYDENPADGESPSTETDCRGSGIYDCPCEADGPDGLCACCRSGECNGSCAAPGMTADLAAREGE